MRRFVHTAAIVKACRLLGTGEAKRERLPRTVRPRCRLIGFCALLASVVVSTSVSGQAMERLFEGARRKSSLESIALASGRVDSLSSFRIANLQQTVLSNRSCALQIVRVWRSGPLAGQSEKLTVDAGDIRGRPRTAMDSTGRLAISVWDVGRVGDATRIATPGGTSYPETISISIGESLEDHLATIRLDAISALVGICEKRF
jgi:hypothetical protein